ncbi:MAG: alpha/beta hydrolase [Acidimicrobiia bacterium]|nr:alpha/beta hydrolase [Acidimicrobiia bacterium]
MHPRPFSRRTLLAGSAATALAVAVPSLPLLAACGQRSSGPSGAFRFEQVAYGPHPQQVADLYVPLDRQVGGVVTLVHGGYWTVGLDRAAMAPLAEQLATLGYAVWNIDYRRIGEADGSGGWPDTLEDTAAAFDALSETAARFELDLSHHAAIGHSAGGQLAFWAAARPQLPSGALGADPVVVPTALVSLSGVLDLDMAARLPDVGRLGDLRRSVRALLGGTPDEVPDRYREASPSEMVPLGRPQLVVHGTLDDVVPAQISESYALDAIAAGDDDVTLSLVEGVDHFDSAQATDVWWSIVTDWLPDNLGR